MRSYLLALEGKEPCGTARPSWAVASDQWVKIVGQNDLVQDHGPIACHVSHHVHVTSRAPVLPPDLLQAPFLNRLEVVAETGLSQADVLLELYETKWKRSIDPLYHEYAY